MTTDQILTTAAIIMICLAVLFTWAALRAGAESQSKQDEINRQEYQKRNDLKGGSK